MKDEIINKAIDRLTQLTGEDFHGYRSEIWNVLAEVYNSNRVEPQVMQNLDSQNDLATEIVEKYGEDCKCGNVGYFVVNRGTYFKPEQVQCEFCYTVEKSKFNLRSDLEKLLEFSKQTA